MRAGWNPGRRNRHAGTAAHGHGEDNRLTIPDSWRDFKHYTERMQSPVRVSRPVGLRDLPFLVEPVRSGCFYPCTVDDIATLLRLCHGEVRSALDFVVLRQPTRKQRILTPVWGRANFSHEVDDLRGRAILIEAMPLQPILWSRSLDPEEQRELDRLRDDGHSICLTRRGIEIRPTAQSLRNTVLYRTLLHEVGHHLDYARNRLDAWGQRTKSAKEDYAHRVAHELASGLRDRGVVPFAPVLDVEQCRKEGLDPAWFLPSDSRVADALADK